MSFTAIHENKILTKISGFTVYFYVYGELLHMFMNKEG